MSSSISADYSPTSNHSYPTDLSPSPSLPTRQSRALNEQRPPPRLSSPHIFRDIFTNEAAGSSGRNAVQLPPLNEINFAETMQDVNRALQSANRAIQTAQEAFQSRRTVSTSQTRRQDIVDLTNSTPSPTRDDDSFLTRTLHPHDSRSTGDRTRTASSLLNQPFYPWANGPTDYPPMFVEEDDPTSRYAGQTDSLAAARRRYHVSPPNNGRRMFSGPTMDRSLMRSGSTAIRRHEEEEAIRRQRIAREQWQQVQQRQQQRDRLQQQRDRILAQSDRTREHNRASGSSLQYRSTNHNPMTMPSFASSSGALLQPIHSRQRTSSIRSDSSSSSVEAVDLTTVNNQNDLAAALLQSQASNPTADPTSSSTEPRSALTAYKCPICLEPPRNATSTICGHLFCHECILETLKNSENMRREDAPPHRKVKGQCPVCRKELTRKEDEGPQRTLVPLEIRLISKKKMEELRRQERKRLRELDNKGKGKGKEKEEPGDGQNVFELSSEDENDEDQSGSSQKENKAKRIKLSASEELDQELFGAFVNDE